MKGNKFIGLISSLITKYKPLYRIYMYRHWITISLIISFIVSSVIFDIVYYYYEYKGITYRDLLMFIVNMLYFNVTTATTVGYGDISPSLWQTRLLAVLYMPFVTTVFVGLVGTFATTIVVSIRKKYFGRAKVDDIDIVIAGGTKDKLESVVQKVYKNNPNDRICVISDFYDEKPELFHNLAVKWIKGSIKNMDTLNMIECFVDKYCILSVNPNNKFDDSFVLLACDNIKLKEKDNKNLRILAEVVRNNLIGFSNDDEQVDYIQISRSAVVAKELKMPGTYDFFKSIFNNRLPGNQYNYTLENNITWKELANSLFEKNAILVAYLDILSSEWKFFPSDKDLLLKKGTVFKYFSKTNLFEEDVVRNDKLLILGFDEYKTCSLVDLYLADSRYKNSEIVILTEKDMTSDFACNYQNVSFKKAHMTDERVLSSSDLDIASFKNILILDGNDEHNFLAYRIIRELNKEARIVCEISSNTLRESLEDKYEDILNQFTEPAQAGQLIQEFQDHGALSLVEKFACDDEKEDVIDYVVKDEKITWLDLQKQLFEKYNYYSVGYKLVDSKSWVFEPEDNLELTKETLIKCMK